MKALVTKTTGLWYEVKSEHGIHVARLRGKFKQENKKITNPLTVGDWVQVEPNGKVENEWLIERIYDRENYISRQSPRKKGHDHLIASNIDQAIVLFTFHTPRTSIGFVDRVLVTLEAYRIPGIVVLNKRDLLSSEEVGNWDQIAEVYEKLGYRTLAASFTRDVAKLHDLLGEKTTLLVGHSGTGKSTMINAIIPAATQQVNEVSSFANKGVHTTTFAEMFFVNPQTKIIDTPGIKELGLSEIESDELGHYFPEMRSYLGQCKFHNCRHVEEPHCLIKNKVEEGEIAFFRYESYLSMLLSEDNRR